VKILRATFRNFIGFKDGMGLDELCIDFTKGNNKIILIKGNNGSGKTSLLSALHPFLGTFDERDSPIIPETDGYKELEISHADHIYKIRLQYLHKKNKCYISEDGVELNENGNVRSYNSIVEEKLGLTEDYFKIARIGRNVSNFIDLPRAERKKYINKFIPNIDEYLESGRIVSEKFRKLDTQLSYIKEVINKYNITDLEASLQDNLSLYKEILERLEKVNGELAVSDNELSKLTKRLSSTEKENHIDSAEVAQKKKDLETYTKSLSKIIGNSEILIDLSKDSEKLLTKLQELKIKRVELTASSTEESKSLQNKLTLKTEKQKAIATKEESLNAVKAANLDELKKEVLNLTKNVDQYKKDLEQLRNEEGRIEEILNSYEIDSNYFEVFCVPLANQIIDLANEIKLNYPGSSESFIKAIESTNSITHIENKLKKQLLAKKAEISATEKKISQKEQLLERSDVLALRPKECKIDTCPFIKDLVNLEEETKDLPLLRSRASDLNTELKSLEEDAEFLLTVTKPLIKRSFQLFNKLETETIFSTLFFKGENGYNTAYLSLLRRVLVNNLDEDLDVSRISKYFKLRDIHLHPEIKRLEDTKKEIESIQGSAKLVEGIKIEIQDLRNEIKSLDAQIDVLRKRAVNTEEALAKNEKRINILENMSTHISNIEDTKKYLDNISAILEIIEQIRASISEVKVGNKKLQEQKSRILKESVPYEKKIKDIEAKIAHYRNFESQLELGKEKYDLYKLVKDSLDIKIGIPLIFSKSFLEIIEEHTNELLNIAFEGKFRINFVISDKEFLIKVLKEDSSADLEDITKASQGQEILTKLSLSLSIILQGIKDYNIIYLDEVDGELDADNRKNFFEILEKQLEVLGSEQCFIISHNEIYDSANCDLILFKGASDARQAGIQKIIYQY